MSMSDWSSYVCSSDLCTSSAPPAHHQRQKRALKSQTGGSRRPLKSLVLLKNHWSGREDSNLRPPHPQCDALPGCATPRPEPRALCATAARCKRELGHVRRSGREESFPLLFRHPREKRRSEEHTSELQSL